MIEDLLSELIQPLRAIKLLSIFLEEQIYDEIIFEVNKNQIDKNENTLAINYAIKLINNDIFKIRKRYYNKMCKEKYNQTVNLAE